jgi:hypothetical protein
LKRNKGKLLSLSACGILLRSVAIAGKYRTKIFRFR